MSDNSKKTWNTKYGARRVRQEAPVLAEAIAAAQGLSDNIDEQADIAASLMGLPREQVHAELLKMAPRSKDIVRTVAFTGPASAPRTFVVERKTTRRIIPAANRTTRSVSA